MMFGSSRKNKSSYPQESPPYSFEGGRRGFWVSGTMMGIIMFIVGLVVLAILWTYETTSVSGVQSVMRQSILGLPGAYAAYGLFQIFGLAAWLVPLALIWFGLFQVFHKGDLPNRLLFAGAILLICACGAMGSQHIVGQQWVVKMGLDGMGGFIGYILGDKLMVPWLGVNWSVILFTLVYAFCFILVTGMKPLPFLKAIWRDYRSWRERTRENEAWSPNDIKPVDEGSLAQKLGQNYKQDFDEEPPPPKKTRRASKKVEEEQPPLPMPARPEPQIIDASQTKIVKTANRPPLSSTGKETEDKEKNVPDYQLPDLNLLHEPAPSTAQTQADKDELLHTQQKIIEILASFGIDVTPGNITRGPTITRYEIYPSIGLRVAKITNLSADIARATKAERINILAPIPGKDTVGIEIANSKKISVPLRELLCDPAFSDSNKKIPLALGKDVYGKVVVGDLAAMPHLLVAGATGSGKSVCINSIISSILFRFSPEDLKFILIDPKVVEMQGYAKLPHLIVPVVTDPRKVLGALRWAVNEMERRYRIFAEVGVRNFESFNNRPREPKSEKQIIENKEPQAEEEVDEEFIEALASSIEGEGFEPAPRNARGGTNSSYYEEEEEDDEEDMPDKFPYVVIIIDELADLMQTASSDMETYISRLTAKARAAGIHLIVATQTPRSDVVTGVIKANIPCRIAFQVSSALDSRIILDRSGAENLVGKGDLYYLPPGSAKLERAQGAFVSDEEVEDLVKHCAAQAEPSFEKEVQEHMESDDMDDGDDANELSKADEDDLKRCMEVIRADQRASVSLLQRRLKFGYNKAARLMDVLEARGIVGPSEGPTKQREVYIK